MNKVESYNLKLELTHGSIELNHEDGFTTIEIVTDVGEVIDYEITNVPTPYHDDKNVPMYIKDLLDNLLYDRRTFEVEKVYPILTNDNQLVGEVLYNKDHEQLEISYDYVPICRYIHDDIDDDVYMLNSKTTPTRPESKIEILVPKYEY